MTRAVTIVHMTVRLSGLLLIVLGVGIWAGRADQVIPVHGLLGFVLVLSLWTLSFFAARAGVARDGSCWRWRGASSHPSWA